VRLGFGDGSEVELATGDPSAIALRAVAALLVQEPADRAENEGDVPSRRTATPETRRIV
jgi:hypothetical protein